MYPNLDSKIALSAPCGQTKPVRRHRPRDVGYRDNREPSLGELLIDPMLHRLMMSDGVSGGALIELIAAVKVGLERGKAN